MKMKCPSWSTMPERWRWDNSINSESMRKCFVRWPAEGKSLASDGLVLTRGTPWILNTDRGSWDDEFNVGRDDALYTSTPLLEALRLIVRYAATHSYNDRRKANAHDE